MGKVPILTLSLQEDHAIMTNLRSLEVADRVYGIDYAAGEAGDIAGLLRCCPHLKECALPVDNNVVESFSLLAALSEELEVLRLPFARFGVDFLRVVEAFHDKRCLPKLQYLHTDIDWDVVLAYIEGHNATCPLRRRICGREEVECLQDMAQDVVDVTRELQLNRKITAAKSDYEKRVQNLVMRLRDTLIYILDARGVDCYVTPFEPSSLGAHRPGKSQVVLKHYWPHINPSPDRIRDYSLLDRYVNDVNTTISFEEWRWRQRSSPTQPYASGRKFFPKTWNQATLVPRDS